MGSLSAGRLLGAFSTGAGSEAGVLSPPGAFAGPPTTADDGEVRWLRTPSPIAARKKIVARIAVVRVMKFAAPRPDTKPPPPPMPSAPPSDL